MIRVPQAVPMKLWHEHLMQRLDEFADMNEAMSARKLYEAGVSAGQAAKMLMANRTGMAN